MLRRDISREWPLMLCIEPLFESFTENMAYIDLQENRCEFTSHDLLQMSTKQCAFFDQTSSLFKFMKWVWITSVRSQLDQNEVAGPPAGANARHAASGPLWSLARVVIGEPDRLLRIPCLQLHGILFRVSGYDMPNHANVISPVLVPEFGFWVAPPLYPLHCSHRKAGRCASLLPRRTGPDVAGMLDEGC